MYLSRIRLQNIRCIGDLEIDLSAGDSLVLLGNNAVGKSTILRSIALALCDPVGASGLLSDMYGRLIRGGEEEGRIELGLRTEAGDSHKIVTGITTRGGGDSEWPYQENALDRSVPSPFVCGYGPVRVLQETRDYSEYVIADAVYTLFAYRWGLQNPELVLRRRAQQYPKEGARLLRRLADLLMLDPDAVSLATEGLFVRSTRQSPAAPFGALADGHRSILNLVLDLFGWTLLARQDEPRGIVLIDELENHLHPSWQRRVLKLLSAQLPHVQFIATSHSPLPAAGVFEEKTPGVRIGKAYVLEKDEDGSVAAEALPALHGYTYDEVLESQAFGTEPRSVAFQDALDRLLGLYTGPESRKKPEFQEARKQLRAISRMKASSIEGNQIADELDAKFRALKEGRGSRAPSDKA